MDEQAKKTKVLRVFETIADGYDAANERISLGSQRSWKKMLTDSVKRRAPKKILDVCCGTGDIAIALAEQDPAAAVTGIDFSPAMLDEAKKKSRNLENVTWLYGDAADLPFTDDQFQAATISFGLRYGPSTCCISDSSCPCWAAGSGVSASTGGSGSRPSCFCGGTI